MSEYNSVNSMVADKCKTIKLNIKQKNTDIDATNKSTNEGRPLSTVEKEFFAERLNIRQNRKTGPIIIGIGIFLAVVFTINTVIQAIYGMQSSRSFTSLLPNIFGIIVILGFFIPIGLYVSKRIKNITFDEYKVYESIVYEFTNETKYPKDEKPYKNVVVNFPSIEGDKHVKIKTDVCYEYKVGEPVFIVSTSYNEHGYPTIIGSRVFPLNYRTSKGDKLS